MKYLLTRSDRNFLLIVRIKFKGKKSLTIPVSFWALEATLEALSDLAWLGEKLFLGWGRYYPKTQHNNKWMQFLTRMPVSLSIGLGVKTLQDLRKHGRFRLAEVEHENMSVYIDLL